MSRVIKASGLLYVYRHIFHRSADATSYSCSVALSPVEGNEQLLTLPRQYLLLEEGEPGSSVHLSSAPLKQAMATLTLREKADLRVTGL